MPDDPERLFKQALEDLASQDPSPSMEEALQRALEMTTPEASGTAWSHPDARPKIPDPEFL